PRFTCVEAEYARLYAQKPLPADNPGYIPFCGMRKCSIRNVLAAIATTIIIKLLISCLVLLLRIWCIAFQPPCLSIQRIAYQYHAAARSITSPIQKWRMADTMAIPIQIHIKASAVARVLMPQTPSFTSSGCGVLLSINA